MDKEKRFGPTQAVIFCGGLGTRLRPLTNNLPKPMVLVNNKPFLQYLLEQLSDQGIKRFLLLTGYLGHKISHYFGDGSQYGWSVDYSAGPLEWDTGRRLWEARSHIDSQFLLLYSDNFIQFNLSRLINLHKSQSSSISLLLAPKLNGNIKVSQNGRITAYDKKRDGEGFDFVEVGYMLVEREKVLKEMADCKEFPDVNFSTVLQKLAQKKEISGLIVKDSYHSISDPERLLLMDEYLRPKKILLIDRDGTINEKSEIGSYVTDWTQFRWLSETKNAMIKLSSAGFKFIVITNQAGVARKIIEPMALQEIHCKMIEDLKNVGVEVLSLYLCPDHWEDKSFTRKPEPGMFFQAASQFKIRMDRCIYIGDDIRDCMAAANAGCGMIYLNSDDPEPILKEFPRPFIKSKSLLDSVDQIISIYADWEL